MLLRSSTLLVLLLLACSARGQIISFEWVQQQGGSTGSATTTCIVTDQNGSCYFGGSFSGIVNFGGTTLSSTGTNDAFVARFSAGGILLWAKQLGAPNNAATTS